MVLQNITKLSELSNEGNSYIVTYNDTTPRPVIVTTFARCFLPLTAKCDGFHCQTARKFPIRHGIHFWATVCKTVRPMLSDRCLSVCPVLSVCNVSVLWPNGLMDQDETWHAGRPRPCSHIFLEGDPAASPKGAQPPIFGPYLLRPNGSRCHLVWS